MIPPAPNKILLLDGGMGSLLFRMGLTAGRAPETWVVEAPEHIESAHRAYVEAGSDVIQTATFGATPSKLLASGLAGRCAQVNARAVDIARRASAGRTLVAGDLGPTGRMLEPMGSATLEEIEEDFRVQAVALAAAGVDVLNIETMFDLREALCAVRAAVSTGLPVWAALTFEPAPDGFYTMMGDELVASLVALRQAGAAVVGLNCSVTSDLMLPMVRAAATAVGGPLIAQPNAGPPRTAPDGSILDADPGTFAADLVEMTRAGARVVGGCCGTTPGFIRMVRSALDRT